jgi:hypothetical protein
VVATPELPGPLDGHDVFGLFDHADDAGVSARVTADAALLLFGHVPAGAAEADLPLHAGHRRGQPLDVALLGGQQVEGDALGALRPDSG